MTLRDQWAEWVLERRFTDKDHRPTLEYLGGVRDTVLDNATLARGETLLDLGCGDGLIGFGALDRGAGEVLFTDISQDLLETCTSAATELGIHDRCRFVPAPADALDAIADASVDVVATRSVLIYVADKARALSEAHRVLRPGGRLSLFEPINRFGLPWPAGWLFGYHLPGLESLVSRVRAVFERHQPVDSDPMLDFDERDLLDLAERTGFATVGLRLDATIAACEPRAWDSFLHVVPNPKLPSLGEAMEQALEPTDYDELSTRLRPLVEQGSGQTRTAVTYLWATKP